MNRKKSLIVAASVIVAFFLGVIFIFKKQTTISTPIGELSVELDLSTGPKVVLNNFKRSESKDGKKLWEITAEKGVFSPNTQEAQVENPKLQFFKKSDVTVTLTSRKAIINFDNQTLANAELLDEVLLVQDNPSFIMTGNRALYDQKQVLIPGPVTIRSDSLFIEGENLVGDVEAEVFTIKNNVKSVIRKES